MNTSTTSDDIRLPQPAHWRFWGTVIWGIVIAAIFQVLQIVVVFRFVGSREGKLSESEFAQVVASAAQDGYVLSLATFATTVVCGGLVVGIVKLKKHSILTDYLALRSVALGTALRWFGLLAGLLVLSDLITILLGRPIVPDFMSAAYATASPVWMFWVALVIAAPLFEETFFRGFLFRGFESSFLGPLGAVLVTAGLWALIHVQ